jgi:hypothetical protein
MELNFFFQVFDFDHFLRVKPEVTGPLGEHGLFQEPIPLLLEVFQGVFRK